MYVLVSGKEAKGWKARLVFVTCSGKITRGQSPIRVVFGSSKKDNGRAKPGSRLYLVLVRTLRTYKAQLVFVLGSSKKINGKVLIVFGSGKKIKRSSFLVRRLMGK